MQFSQHHLQLAKELARLCLSWEPGIGHYVYDEDGAYVDAPSVQSRVFLIGDADFVSGIADRDRSTHRLVWLPTWHDAKEILHSLAVSDVDIELDLVRSGAIADGRELLALYELIAQRLSDERLRVIYRVESTSQVQV